MTLQGVYRATQIAAKVHQLNYTMASKLTQHTADCLLVTPKTSAGRLAQAIRLGALGGASSNTTLTNNHALDNILRATTVSIALPDAWQQFSLGTLGRWSLTSLALMGAAAVGTGSANTWTGAQNSTLRRAAGAVMQYGVLGLPQGLFVDQWDKLQRAGRTNSAAACLLTATIFAVPLEAARSGLVVFLSLATITWMALGCAWGAVVGALGWIFHDSRTRPADYVLGLSEAKNLNEYRFGWQRTGAPKHKEAPDPFGEFGSRSAYPNEQSWQESYQHRSGPSAHKPQEGDNIRGKPSVRNPSFARPAAKPQPSAQMMQTCLNSLRPVLTATTQDQAREALLNVGNEQLFLIESLDSLNQYCDRLLKNKERSDLHVPAGIIELFAESDRQIGSPAWVASQRKIFLFLHPDKLTAPGRDLPPDVHALATSCFCMVTSLRLLYQAYAKSKNRRL